MAFEFGPFSFDAESPMTIDSRSDRLWTLNYGTRQLAMHYIDAHATRSAVLDSFRGDMALQFERIQYGCGLSPVRLESAEGHVLGSFLTAGGVIDGMNPGMPDDSSAFWLVTRSPVRSMRVTLSEFAALSAQHAAAPNEWMQAALPGAVLTLDPAEWRAPTAWEIRHVVGDGSMTGISGAKAAELIGVSPQNFRKYTAHDGAATRQNMSFAMWHFLLQRLGVQRI